MSVETYSISVMLTLSLDNTDAPKRVGKFKPAIIKEGQGVLFRQPYTSSKWELELKAQATRAFTDIQRTSSSRKKNFNVDLNKVFDIKNSP